MNDGMLSQDEIDALLKVSEEEDKIDLVNQEDYLSTIEVDTLGEIGNISIGSSATTLSTLLNQKVEITTPEVTIVTQSELIEEFVYGHVKIQVNYIEGFTGRNVLVIRSEDAAIISDIMLGGDGSSADAELNEIHLSAVQEAMNQMMGAAATSMSTVFEKRVDISPPLINQESGKQSPEQFEDEDVYVKVSFQLKVGSLIDSSFMQLIPLGFAKQLVNQLLNHANEAVVEPQVDIQLELPEKQNVHQEMNRNEQRTEHTGHSPQYIGNSIDQQNASIHQAVFSNFDQVEVNQKEHRNLDMLLDIPLKVTVELGRTNRTIKEILDLSAGSILELDKLAGEPVDILVNEKLIAKGEVVVIDENFGVRVTDIISQTDRLMRLN